MKLKKLLHSKPAFKRLNRRMERYHGYSVDLAFVEYYEMKKVGDIPTIEEKLVLHKRKAKAEAKKLKNIKRRKTKEEK